ncbi:MAG: hypothetical protein PVJ67_03090 [Candidatus Pacearchaeota archaeon]|jgi:hypothetical protein
MDLEEIEDQYKLNVEHEDEAFLKKVNLPENKGKRKGLEQEYHEKLKLLMSEYQNNVSKFLKRKDAVLFTKNEAPKDEEIKKKLPTKLKIEKFDMNPGYKERTGVWWKVFRFNFRINFRNFVRRFLPAKFVLFYLTMKLEIINAYIELKFYIGGFFKKVFLKIKYFLILIKNLFIRVFNFIKGFFRRVSSRIFKNKTSDREGNGKEKADNKTEEKPDKSPG